MIDGLDKKEVWLSMNYDLMSNGNLIKVFRLLLTYYALTIAKQHMYVHTRT